MHLQVLGWLLTGDERYARSAAAIIDAWASTNQSFAGKNAPLVRQQPSAGLPG